MATAISFSGRENELIELNNLFKNRKATLVICHGRRRIGKSTLIEKFGEKADQFIEIQGLDPHEKISNTDQLNTFSEQFSTQSGFPKLTIENWNQAFSLLDKAIGTKKTVVFIDEISWLAQGDKNFAGQLKIAWDTAFKKHPKLVLVLCGSVSSWIEKNILNNTGFAGRISYDLKLEELDLKSCNTFWGKNHKQISSTEKLKMLSVMGGIPRYLEEIRPELPAEEIIHQLCFKKEGFLFSEFDHIFNSIFDRRAPFYKKILQSLVYGSHDLNAISKAVKVDKSGTLSIYLSDLEQAGFIAKDSAFNLSTGKVARFAKYRLKDNYTRFYLRYIEEQKARINTGLTFNSNLETFIKWETIKGLQFENLVLNNLPILLKKLEIKSESVLYASPYFQNKTNRQQACQIDLLIITKYSYYVCEMKFRNTIEPSVISEVKDKCSKLKTSKQSSVRPVIIYNGELAPAIRKQDYFFKTIDLAALLY